jgi:hypothetical protein
MTSKDNLIPRNAAVEEQIFGALERMGWKYTATSIDGETRTNIVQQVRRDWEADYKIGERLLAAKPGEKLIFKCLDGDQIQKLQSAITARAYTNLGSGNYKTSQDADAGCVTVNILVPGLNSMLDGSQPDPAPEGN